jgi:hypothetical protein
MADPLNALYDRDDPFGFGSDETERLRQSMTHNAPDVATRDRVAKAKSILGALPPVKQLGGLWNALTAPPTAQEMYGGPAGDWSERALGLSNAQFTGAGFQRPSGASAGVFAGPKAQTADLKALEHAKMAESRGRMLDSMGKPAPEWTTPESIWRDTGWFQGADRKWRFEIPDTNATINPQAANVIGSGPMSNLLQHPELYKAYPQLGEIKAITKVDAEGERGATSFTDRVRFGPKVFEDARDPNYLNPSIALHEIQHPIQDIEGFAQGGSVNRQAIQKNPFELEIARVGQRFREIENTPIEKVTPEMRAEHQQLGHILKRNAAYMQERGKSAIDNYLRLAGEVEARNAQYRWAQDKYHLPPWETETQMQSGYPRDKQIVAFSAPAVGPHVELGRGNILYKSVHEPHALPLSDQFEQMLRLTGRERR